jgi:AraC-like DNA-binding protein
MTSARLAPRAGRVRGPSTISLTRASGVAPLISFLDSIGAPTSQLLQQAGMPRSLLEEQEGLVPLHLVQRFAEIAARWTDIGNLGVAVGQQVCAYDLGAFGQLLRRAITVYDYLQTGARLIGSVTARERFWLTREGDVIRFHHFQPGHPGAGRYHSDLYAIVVTISMLRRFLGPGWKPLEVSLFAKDSELIGDRAVFGDTRVRLDQSHSSFTMPTSMLRRAMPAAALDGSRPHQSMATLKPRMPSSFVESVEALVESLLLANALDIDVVAEAAAMSTRTFQRHLRACGLSYSDIVQQTRIRLASDWLAGTGTPIAEIAATLGYRDPAHFSRAFRSRSGISPQQYRNQHR